MRQEENVKTGEKKRKIPRLVGFIFSLIKEIYCYNVDTIQILKNESTPVEGK